MNAPTDYVDGNAAAGELSRISQWISPAQRDSVPIVVQRDDSRRRTCTHGVQASSLGVRFVGMYC